LTLRASQKKTGNTFVAGFTTRSLLPMVTTLSSQFIASTLSVYNQSYVGCEAENMPLAARIGFRALSGSVPVCPKLLL
jgi:hypothetical protein